MAKSPQDSLELPPQYGWGGARAGAGRKPTGVEPCISHRRELGVDGRSPVHVTLRVRADKLKPHDNWSPPPAAT